MVVGIGDGEDELAREDRHREDAALPAERGRERLEVRERDDALREVHRGPVVVLREGAGEGRLAGEAEAERGGGDVAVAGGGESVGRGGLSQYAGASEVGGEVVHAASYISGFVSRIMRAVTASRGETPS